MKKPQSKDILLRPLKTRRKALRESELFDSDNGSLAEADDPDSDGGDDGDVQSPDTEIDDNHLKVDSLKIAMKIIKLMDKADVEDLISVSTKVSAFLKEYKPGADIEAILGLKDKDDSDGEDSNSGDENGDEGENEAGDGGDDDITMDDIDGLDDDFDVPEGDDPDGGGKDEGGSQNEPEDASETDAEIPDQFII